MIDKGYDHPLYSLDLLGPGVVPEEGGRYLVPVAQGLLTVRPALRRRARALTTEACDRAVVLALALHERSAAVLGAYGLDGVWAAGLRHWQRRMWQEEEARQRLAAELATQWTARRGALSLGRELWQRLVLAEALAGLGRPPRAPVGQAALRAALDAAVARLGDPARQAAATAHGFGPERRAQLQELRVWLAAADRRLARLEQARRGHSDRLLVIRAALVGDLQRLSQVARCALPEGQRGAFQPGRLGLR